MRLTTRQKMGLARAVQRPVLAARRARGAGPIAEVRRGGIRWALDLREGIDFNIWLAGRFERSTTAAYHAAVQPGWVVVDVGANIGAHTLPLARAVGDAGRVHAFEPSAVAFARLRANLDLNPELHGRVTATQAMLVTDDHAAVAPSVVSSWPLLARRELDPTHPGLATTTEGAVAVRLDTGLAQLGVDRVDLIKLDVDGYECDVLGGAIDTLRRHRPLVLTELAPAVAELTGHSVPELVALLQDSGYELWDLRLRHRIASSQVDQLLRRRASMNVLARPLDRPGATS